MAALGNESHLGGSYVHPRGRRCAAASIRCCDAAFRRGFNLGVSNAMISTGYSSQKVNIIRIIGTTSPLGCISAPQIVPQSRKSPPLIFSAGRDGEYDIAVDREPPGARLRYAKECPWNDPYVVIGSGAQVGRPFGIGAVDNITNHAL